MQKKLDSYLKTSLQRLEKAYEEVVKTSGYNKESQNLKLLAELIKEQIKDENPRTATR